MAGAAIDPAPLRSLLFVPGHRERWIEPALASGADGILFDLQDAVPEAELQCAQAAGVHLLGVRDDMEDLYAAMDLFVLGSYREGVPRAAMEASAMGVPVIATDVRGCRQVVDDGVTGLLVPPRDSTRLADAVDRLVGDPAHRAAMGAAARRKAVVEFDERDVIARTLAVYERLLAAREPVS